MCFTHIHKEFYINLCLPLKLHPIFNNSLSSTNLNKLEVTLIVTFASYNPSLSPSLKPNILCSIKSLMILN